MLRHVASFHVPDYMESLPVPFKPVHRRHEDQCPTDELLDLSDRAAEECLENAWAAWSSAALNYSSSTEIISQICPQSLNAGHLADSLTSNKIIQTGQVTNSETVRVFFLLPTMERKISSLRLELAIFIKCTHGWAFWPWYKWLKAVIQIGL